MLFANIPFLFSFHLNWQLRMSSILSRLLLYNTHFAPQFLVIPSPSSRISSRRITCQKMSCTSETVFPTLRTVTISYSELAVRSLSDLVLSVHIAYVDRTCMCLKGVAVLLIDWNRTKMLTYRWRLKKALDRMDLEFYQLQMYEINFVIVFSIYFLVFRFIFCTNILIIFYYFLFCLADEYACKHTT